jgi:hypothetical protein
VHNSSYKHIRIQYAQRESETHEHVYVIKCKADLPASENTNGASACSGESTIAASGSRTESLAVLIMNELAGFPGLAASLCNVEGGCQIIVHMQVVAPYPVLIKGQEVHAKMGYKSDM